MSTPRRRLLVVLGAAALVGGLIEAATLLQRVAETHTCAELEAAPASDSYLRLTHCQADPLTALVGQLRAFRVRPPLRKVYVPLRPAGEPMAGVVAVLASSDPALLGFLDEATGLPEDASAAEVQRVLVQHAATVERWSQPLEAEGRAEHLDAKEMHDLLIPMVNLDAPILEPGRSVPTTLVLLVLMAAAALAYLVASARAKRVEELPYELRPAEEPQLGEMEALRRKKP